jgi:hypothetical protein
MLSISPSPPQKKKCSTKKFYLWESQVEQIWINYRFAYWCEQTRQENTLPYKTLFSYQNHIQFFGQWLKKLENTHYLKMLVHILHDKLYTITFVKAVPKILRIKWLCVPSCFISSRSYSRSNELKLYPITEEIKVGKV